MSDLREQVDALPKMWHAPRGDPRSIDPVPYVEMDAALAVFAERERELRARIEALPVVFTGPLKKYGPDRQFVTLEAVLALFDEAVSDGE